MIFYSIAAHYAEYLGIKWIIGGHNMHDVKFFKDASKGYIEKINSLFQEGCLMCDGQPYRIVLPLAEMDRREIVQLAIKLELPVELTWSCHKEGDMHCGQCYACKQRLEAFGSLGLQDPVFAKP
jgi:7-cyano-7-deazaguanine synthase